MPIEKHEGVLPQRSRYDIQLEQETPEFTDVFVSQLNSMFIVEGVSWLNDRVGSVLDNSTSSIINQPDDLYDVATDLQGYEGYSSSFVDVRNRTEADRIKQRIDEELERKNIIASAGTGDSILASVATLPFDPLTYITLGAGAAAGTVARGGLALRGAGKGAAVFGAYSVAEESALQQLQETRTFEEGVANIAITTAVGSLVGSLDGILTRAQMVEKTPQLREALLEEPAGMGGSVGAASRATTLEDETLQSAAYGERALSFQDPVLRTANSPSVETRRISQQIASQSLLREKNIEGVANSIPVENAVKAYDLFRYNASNDFDDAFMAYRGRANTMLGRGAESINDLIGRSRANGILTRAEFGEEVIKAMRRGDESAIPEIAQAARQTRARLIDPVYQKAVAAGIFTGEEAVTTAKSYVTRLWDRSKIMANRSAFKEVNLNWLKSQRDLSKAELQKITSEAAEKTDDLTARISELEFAAKRDDAELDWVADQIVERIKGSPTGRLPYDFDINEVFYKSGPKAGLRGPAKDRIYDIPDELVEKYLVNDYDAVMTSYVRTLAPDIELMRRGFTPDMQQALKDIELDYAKLYKGKSPKKQRRLNSAFEADKRDILAMTSRLRGTYGQPDDFGSFMAQAERFAMSLNYVRLLGGMTISAFTDISRPVMVHGMSRVFGDGIKPMIKNFRAFKASAAEVKETGTALDMVLDTRSRAMAGFDEYMALGNRVDGVMNSMSNKFSVLSLMAPWNATLKQFTGVLTQSRMLKASIALAAGEDIGKAEMQNLALNYINRALAERIAAQFKKYGQETDGVMLANAKLWDDFAARDAFRAGVLREVDQTIVTPGLDKPLWMSKAGWRLLGQFRSFAFSSVSKTMLSSLQRKDAAVMQGFAMSIALGMGVYALKQGLAGKETSDDYRVWISEGIDRAGVTGWFFDANNIAEKITRGRLGVNRITGGPLMSRYASRSALEAVFGPTYGALGDITQVIGAAAADEWTEKDTSTVRKLIPFQNLFYIRGIFDDAEKGINEAMGVKQ